MLGLCIHWPYALRPEGTKGSSELDLIGRFRCVLSICSKLPNDHVLLVTEKHPLYQIPKQDELSHLLHSWHAPQTPSPALVYQLISHFQFLAPCQFVEQWCNVSWRPAIQPTRLPELSSASIAKLNPGTCSEKLFVNLINRYISTNPRLVYLFPLVPKPTKPQSSAEHFKIEHTEASKFFWPFHLGPLNQTMATIGLCRSLPQKTTSDLVHLLDCPLLQWKEC